MNISAVLSAPYQSVADEYYDAALHPTCRNFGELSERFISPRLPAVLRAGARVLDVGAGRSVAATAMARAGMALATLIILDSAPAMLAHSREWISRGAIGIASDARATGLDAGGFDVIVASLGDPYNQPEFWREAARLLKPTGQCLFTTPTHDWACRFRLGSDPEAAEFVLADGRIVNVPSFTLPNPSQIAMIQEAGLNVREVQAYSRADLSGPVSPKLGVDETIPIIRGYTAEKL